MRYINRLFTYLLTYFLLCIDDLSPVYVFVIGVDLVILLFCCLLGSFSFRCIIATQCYALARPMQSCGVRPSVSVCVCVCVCLSVRLSRSWILSK